MIRFTKAKIASNNIPQDDSVCFRGALITVARAVGCAAEFLFVLFFCRKKKEGEKKDEEEAAIRQNQTFLFLMFTSPRSSSSALCLSSCNPSKDRRGNEGGSEGTAVGVG